MKRRERAAPAKAANSKPMRPAKALHRAEMGTWRGSAVAVSTHRARSGKGPVRASRAREGSELETDETREGTTSGGGARTRRGSVVTMSTHRAQDRAMDGLEQAAPAKAANSKPMRPAKALHRAEIDKSRGSAVAVTTHRADDREHPVLNAGT
ncbi:hypothetical protein RSOL_284810, partial [Rhizoctonia solani AG-3 Rhs1AP]